MREGRAKVDGTGEQLRVAGSLEEQERRAFVLYDPSDGRRSIASWRQPFEHLRGISRRSFPPFSHPLRLQFSLIHVTSTVVACGRVITILL